MKGIKRPNDPAMVAGNINDQIRFLNKLVFGASTPHGRNITVQEAQHLSNLLQTPQSGTKSRMSPAAGSEPLMKTPRDIPMSAVASP